MADEKVLKYKDSLKEEAEKLLLSGFPATIVKLNALLDTPQFKNRNFAEVYQQLNIPVPPPLQIATSNNHVAVEEETPPTKRPRVEENEPEDAGSVVPQGTKVMAFPNGLVACNKNLTQLVEIVKPHIRKLVEDSNTVKMWISYLIPKIEDGNNFGVSIQEATLAEVESVESEAASVFDQISRYFISRAKIVSKVAKFPHIEDYRRAVQELDEKEYLSLWLALCEIRNRYCTLHDIVLKNLDKIKKPRPSNATECMY